MKYLLLSLFISASALAGNGSGNVSSVIGLGAMGATTSAVSTVPLSQIAASSTKIFTLFAGGNFTAGNYSPLYKNGVAYQSAAIVHCFNIRSSGETGGILWQIVDDSGAAITFNQSGALTTGLFQGGAAAQYAMRAGVTANIPHLNPGVWQSASGRYLGVQLGFSARYEISMDCYEE